MPKQILVVDDDPDLSLLMALFLRKQGHEVITAGDGRAALERVRASAPDLVVLDWNMPHLDGLGLATAIRGELGLTSLPLLMVTALPDHAQALAAGVDRVVAKPFTSAVLVGAVEDLLAGPCQGWQGPIVRPGRVSARCSRGTRAWSCDRGTRR